MNTKKKNKKANKPPNPNPPQNRENVPKKEEEKVEELMKQCEVKESVPQEICSKAAEVPVSDDKDIQSETPNKPKRNKGKNKKQIEENIDVPEKPQVVEMELITTAEESFQKDVAEDKEVEDKENLSNEVGMVPSTRKKKNKKKAQEKPIQEPIPVTNIEGDDNAVTAMLKEEKKESTGPINTEIKELLSSKSETPKQEGKKKKNKKKNRNDSEKSDNVSLYDSTSQNILAEDIPKTDQPSNTLEGKTISDDLKLELQTVKIDSITAEETEFKAIEVIKETNIDDENTKESPKPETKCKKKNKKDKKQQQKDINMPFKSELVTEVSMPTEEILTQTEFSSESLQDIKESLEISLDTKKGKESSPKPKTKIAKPVEKKQKRKSESEFEENIISIDSPEKTMKADETKQKLFTEQELNLEETSSVTIINKHIEDQIKSHVSNILQPVENIDIPSDHEMEKKRKKSPKLRKNQDNDDKPAQDLDREKISMKVVTETSKTILDLQPKMQVMISESAEARLYDTESDEILKIENEQIIDLNQTKPDERSFTPDTKKSKEEFEIKTSKKKKKTHKVLEMETPKIEIPQIIGEEQASIHFEQCLAADKEVKNLTRESDVIDSGSGPDVHFVRSSSEQLLDSNNNTVIQEVVNIEDVKTSQQIPHNEGSEAIPTCTQEPHSSRVRMPDIGTKIPTEEKTDVKSKMMEVNQDMEELRLSIERSLAEFAALENCENATKQTTESLIQMEKTPLEHEKKEVEQVAKKITTEPKENISEVLNVKEIKKESPILLEEAFTPVETPPVCPTRKDNKGKNKSKKRGKDISTTVTATSLSDSSSSQPKDSAKEEKKEKSEKDSENKSESQEKSQEKGKQQSAAEKSPVNKETIPDIIDQTDFEPIDNFEDALTSSIDDVNKTFEMIAKDVDDDNIEFQKKLAANKPEISITAAEDSDKNRDEKVHPVSQPKNLLGHTDIPVQSNRTDYKKEKNKTPNARQARVKIKDAMDIESIKQSKESQTDNKKSRKISDKSVKESFSRVKNNNEEYVYKYSFRKVFLQSACHVCNRDLSQVRVPCGYCNLIFYCSAKHKDEDWPKHQALCFAVSTLAHMKDQKHIYADAANTTGQDYRLLRMQMIVSCEKVLKRRLVPWEQELMLYPRICAEVTCREWRQGKIKDCNGCGQLSFCAAYPDHLPKAHSRWCKSYSLYQKLVTYQQTKGRLEPPLPTKVLEGTMPGKMNEVLAAMYEEKIDMNDIQYASLTQIATAPLTTAYCLQLYRGTTGVTNGLRKKHPFTIHVVGAELQFEADALNKWEIFFLHLRPDVEELRVVLVSPQLNPGNLPLDLLGRIKLCDNCHQNKRQLIFKFEDKKNYFEYRCSEDFINPDIICAFNPSIQRSSIYNGKDPWPASADAILKLKVPFIVTSYTLNELRKDIARIKEVSEIDFKFVSEPCFNSFASVRPDRNFISDDEMPLLFKNYCVAVVLGC